MSDLHTASPTPEPVLTVSQDKDIVTEIERFDVPVDQQVEAIQD